jgi:hypothetical protein
MENYAGSDDRPPPVFSGGLIQKKFAGGDVSWAAAPRRPQTQAANYRSLSYLYYREGVPFHPSGGTVSPITTGYRFTRDNSLNPQG